MKETRFCLLSHNIRHRINLSVIFCFDFFAQSSPASILYCHSGPAGILLRPRDISDTFSLAAKSQSGQNVFIRLSVFVCVSKISQETLDKLIKALRNKSLNVHLKQIKHSSIYHSRWLPQIIKISQHKNSCNSS